MIKSRLTCIWLSSTGEPRTLDDGTILFQLCGTNMDRQNVQLIQFDLNTTALTSEASYCASTGCIVLEEVPACDDYFQYRAVTMRSLNGFDCREASLENEAVYLMRNSSGLETEIDVMDDSALAVCLDEGWTIRPVPGTGYQAVPSFRLLEETKLANLINGNVIRDTFCLIPSSTMRNDPGTPTKGNPFKSGGTIERRVSESSDDLVDLELSIFPNPVEGDFTVTANDEIRELTCFDLYGKVVFRAESLSGSDQYRISGDHFTSGVYLVWIRTKAGWASTRVVIR